MFSETDVIFLKSNLMSNKIAHINKTNIENI